MISKFREKLKERNIDNFIVAKSSNLFYLLGIYNLSGILIFQPESTILLTSKFYRYTAEKLDVNSNIYSNKKEREITLKNMDIEGKILSDSPSVIREYFEAEKSDLLDEIRQRKSKSEVDRIKKASKVSTKAMEALKNNLNPEITEWKLASIADRDIRSSGCYNAFETIVHAPALEPHRSPEDKEICNQLVVVDLGAKYKGYCSDMTRTFCINPTEGQKKLYKDVLDIYNSIFDKIEVGAKFSSLETLAEDLADDKGYNSDKNFLHRIGHSLGVDIHENPGFDPETDQKIGEGMVFTLEPGLYVPGIGGVRIEDTIYITKRGKKEILTKFPKKL